MIEVRELIIRVIVNEEDKMRDDSIPIEVTAESIAEQVESFIKKSKER